MSRFGYALNQGEMLYQKKNSELFDYSELFDKLNQEAFEGKLVRNFEFTSEIAPNHLGVVYYSVARRGGPPVKVLRFGMTNKYALSPEAFLRVFLHEMIHVWQIQTHARDYGHGDDFMAKKAELEAKGYSVSKSDTVDYSLPEEDRKTRHKKVRPFALVSVPGHDLWAAFDLTRVKDLNTRMFGMLTFFTGREIVFLMSDDPMLDTASQTLDKRGNPGRPAVLSPQKAEEIIGKSDVALRTPLGINNYMAKPGEDPNDFPAINKVKEGINKFCKMVGQPGIQNAAV